MAKRRGQTSSGLPLTPEDDSAPGVPSAAPGESFDFEKAVEEIEAAIARIESGEAGLERSIAEYERGTALIRRCRDALHRAEQRVEELTAQMRRDLAAPAATPPGPAGGARRAGGPSAPARATPSEQSTSRARGDDDPDAPPADAQPLPIEPSPF